MNLLNCLTHGSRLFFLPLVADQLLVFLVPNICFVRVVRRLSTRKHIRFLGHQMWHLVVRLHRRRGGTRRHIDSAFHRAVGPRCVDSARACASELVAHVRRFEGLMQIVPNCLADDVIVHLMETHSAWHVGLVWPISRLGTIQEVHSLRVDIKVAIASLLLKYFLLSQALIRFDLRLVLNSTRLILATSIHHDLCAEALLHNSLVRI